MALRIVQPGREIALGGSNSKAPISTGRALFLWTDLPALHQMLSVFGRTPAMMVAL